MIERLRIAALAFVGVGLAVGLAAADEAENPSFYLVNCAGSAISRVYASPAGMSAWGSNRLTDREIAPGQNAPIRLPADGNCIYDIRVIYANGRSDERRGLNACEIDNLTFPRGTAAASVPGPARARRSQGDPSFVLVNRSQAILNEIYLSPPGDDSWGEDRLGDDTIAAGGTRAVRLPPGECFYDVRVVFANGDAIEKRRLNLCEIIKLRVP